MTNSRVEGSSGRAARKLRFALMGPAFIAAIGYIDPGNFATNIQAGASFGYKLLWVVVWANLMAMLIQMLSAKLGIATGKNLAEQIRDQLEQAGSQIRLKVGSQGSMKSQMKKADQSGAIYALIYGEREAEAQQLAVKTLATAEQTAVAVAEIVPFIIEKFSSQ